MVWYHTISYHSRRRGCLSVKICRLSFRIKNLRSRSFDFRIKVWFSVIIPYYIWLHYLFLHFCFLRLINTLLYFLDYRRTERKVIACLLLLRNKRPEHIHSFISLSTKCFTSFVNSRWQTSYGILPWIKIARALYRRKQKDSGTICSFVIRQICRQLFQEEEEAKNDHKLPGCTNPRQMHKGTVRSVASERAYKRATTHAVPSHHRRGGLGSTPNPITARYSRECSSGCKLHFRRAA